MITLDPASLFPTQLALAGAPIEFDMAPAPALLLAALLILGNGFFVAAEFALVKVRATQVEPHRESRRGRLTLQMIDHLDAYLSACQLGITLTSLGLGWIGEPAFAWMIGGLFERFGGSEEALHAVSLTLSFVTISVLHIVVGEMAPKSLAIRRAQPVSLFVAAPLYLFSKATYPAIWLLNSMANLLLRAIGIEPARDGELAPSEEEIRSILASEHESKLTDEKRELLDNVFELSDRMARQVMVPRSEVVHLDITEPIAANLTRARNSGHTRFPLCDGDLDHVLGLVHIKDLFRAEKEPKSLLDIRRDTFFVPETVSLEHVLRRMRNERIHMAAVLDEHGGISGIITLENVIEEIVGEIQDEFDYERPEITKESEGVYQVLGSVLVQDLEDELDVELGGEERDEDTIAGVVLSEIGRRARVGDRVRIGPLDIEVREVDHNRISALRVQHAAPPGEVAEA